MLRLHVVVGAGFPPHAHRRRTALGESLVSSFADRLRQARQGRFVGRTVELDCFRTALNAPEPPFYILYIHGPGGIGKSTLLREYLRLAAEAGVPCACVDAQNVEPTAVSFLAALAASLDLSPTASPFEALHARAGRQVLILDTCELLAPLDAWLREDFLPRMPSGALVVMASRLQPSAPWRSDPGWQSLLRIVALRNLSPDQSRDYLRRREVPDEQHDTVVSFTHGHPLALSLVADSYVHQAATEFQPEESPDLVKSLLERFVASVPGPGYRAALEASALVHVTTEPLLAELLALPEAREIFEWLRALSFIDSSRFGLQPHELARTAIEADLRWRNPERYAELHRRARAYYGRRLQETAGRDQQLVLYEYVYLHRNNSAVRSVFEWQNAGSLAIERAEPEDFPALREVCLRHEGEESAKWLAYWWERQPERFLVVRERSSPIAGFLVSLVLSAAAPADLQKDPATKAAWAWLTKYAPPRDGDVVLHFRHWMSAELHQGICPVQSLLVVNIVQQYFATPGLAFHFLPVAEPEFWKPAFEYANLSLLESAEFMQSGRRVGVFGHDWRKVSPFAWLGLLAEREMGLEPERPAASAQLLVLSREEFDAAVRDGLRRWTLADGLRDNPLLHTRLVTEKAGPEANKKSRAEALREVFKEVATAMKASPRDLKLLRPVHYTYFQPLETQEMVADRLALPFSTYRRHLTSGIARFADLLWSREVSE